MGENSGPGALDFLTSKFGGNTSHLLKKKKGRLSSKFGMSSVAKIGQEYEVGNNMIFEPNSGLDTYKEIYPSSKVKMLPERTFYENQTKKTKDQKLINTLLPP